MTMDSDDVVAAVEAGDLDGHLDDLVKACFARARDGAVEMVWRFDWGGDQWDAKSVTLGELVYAQRRAGAAGPDGSYRRELTPMVSPGDALALLVAHLHMAKGLSEADAVAQVGKVTAAELGEALDEYELVRPGKSGPGSGPGTTS